MSEEARAILTEHLEQRLRTTVHLEPIGDWPERANGALDEWEEESRRQGPRVESFDAQTRTVRMALIE
ncbi:hypothetical protein [Methylobacterium trifolii]|uniref:Addiction module protein n=1 Tax=Methylobacterium trifolii TaxID=1003092 RepID=A0ABQ4U7X3_9HYPH|nr:hypothetical protein [Methylobacterium trifolii]GJE62512.1 hypothetical protein MPOCJGCO_4645 [Methylobacterium trifolii]